MGSLYSNQKSISVDSRASSWSAYEKPFHIWQSFLKDKNVASIVPSSATLVKAVCEEIDFGSARNILEYGAGDGPITEELLELMHPAARLSAFETNSELVEELTSRFSDPRLRILPYSAEDVLRVTPEPQSADVIVSGIPFSFFDDEKALKIIENSCKKLSSEGVFILYQFSLPPCVTTKRIRNLLRHNFYEMSTKRVLWSLPPMQVIVCRPNCSSIAP